MQIYGIDLSKEKFDVAYVGSKEEYQGTVVKNNLIGICKFVEGLPPDACLCAEHTGCYGDTLVFVCNQLDIPISLVPGYTIKHSLGMVKGKTDPIDARRLFEYGSRFQDKLKFKTYSPQP